MKTIFISAMIMIIFTSCGPQRVYTTGSYGSLASYTEKQHYVDQNTTKTYISGDLSFGKHMQEGEKFDDSKTIASIRAHRTTTGKYFNYYYGMGASLGSYKFKEGYGDFLEDGQKEAFYIIDLKTGINYTYTRPKIDYRFFGLELGYKNEFGPYQSLLDDMENAMDENLIVINKKSLFTYQFYSEYVFKISDKEAITIGGYAGGIFGIKDREGYEIRSGYSGFTIGLRFNKYSLHYLYESGQNEIRSSKIGLTYQL